MITIKKKSLISVFLLIFFGISESVVFKPPCRSPIFCYGDLLKTVQLLEVLKDRRAYFALKMRYDEDVILEDFKNLQATKNLTKENVRDFVLQHFEDSGAIQYSELRDYIDEQELFDEIADPKVRIFARDLHQLWPNLTRVFGRSVLNNPSPYSYIPVPNEFIIPGGRFNEYYYWDTYWIIEGLLISNMFQTAKGILDNFIYLVHKYGFVPNGGKIYYLNRSQPPLLIHMANLYFKHTQDVEWLRSNVDYLAVELQYWLDNKLVQVETEHGIFTLAQYIVRYSEPRPESYLNDYNAASIWDIEQRRQKTYVGIKSATESGWDFSSRWLFDKNGNVSYNISYIQTQRVIPVDLNAYLCGGFYKIARLYGAVGNTNASDFWHDKAKQWKDNVNGILWNTEDQIWYDYDIVLDRHRRFFYPSNVAPLWAGCYEDKHAQKLGKLVLDYLRNEGVLDYPGGIPTSRMSSGQQWDFPNAWPPLQHLVVYALMNSGHPDAMKAGRNLAEKWVSANMAGFYKYGEMFEKYDVREAGLYGGGGEYPVQAGFGWSNGVVLRFIHDFYR